MNVEYTTCIICGSEHIVRKYLVSGFTIVQCRDCSLSFVKERLTQGELSNYYKLIEDIYVYTDKENVQNLSYYYLELRNIIKTEGLSTGKILDIGCSGGYFLDVMEGWERYGIELSSPYAELAKTKYGSNIHIGTLEDYKCPDCQFDIITLQDVLDHMINPLQALKRCNSILKPNGLIVIKVHNNSCLFAKLSGARFYAIIPPYHLTYFNKRSLVEALSRAGFKVLYHKYIAHMLFLKTIPYNLSRRFSMRKETGFFSSLFKLLETSSIGKIKIRKNLYDIITVIAKKGL